MKLTMKYITQCYENKANGSSLGAAWTPVKLQNAQQKELH